MINLYNGDCFDIIPSLPDESIDMILCDLPYGTTKNKWDNVIDLDWLWESVWRVSKPNAAVIFFGQDKFSAKMMLSDPNHRYNLIWDKGARPSGFLNANRMPLRNHEDIMVFYKKLPTYNPQFTIGEPLHGMGTKYKEGGTNNNNYGKIDSTSNPSANRTGDTKKHPKSICRFIRPHPPIHPTQKPVQLCEYLIKSYTNELETVLDFTMGSGTTGVACKNTNRNFIGIEKEEAYFKTAEERINSQMRLPTKNNK